MVKTKRLIKHQFRCSKFRFNLGDGSWGTTLAKILGDNGKETLVWAYEPDVVAEINEDHANERFVPGARLDPRVRATTELEEVCRACQLILMVVPSPTVLSTAIAPL